MKKKQGAECVSNMQKLLKPILKKGVRSQHCHHTFPSKRFEMLTTHCRVSALSLLPPWKSLILRPSVKWKHGLQAFLSELWILPHI